MKTLKVTTITRILRDSVDVIYLLLEAPSPYPELEAKAPGLHQAYAHIDVRHGYGREWVIETFGQEPDETIDVRSHKEH